MFFRVAVRLKLSESIKRPNVLERFWVNAKKFTRVALRLKRSENTEEDAEGVETASQKPNQSVRAAEIDVRKKLGPHSTIVEEGRFAFGGRVAGLTPSSNGLPRRQSGPGSRFAVASLLVTRCEAQQLRGLKSDDFACISDPAIHPADIWTPFAAGGGNFGDQEQALRLVGAEAQPNGNVGRGVNVVILDYGISKEWLRRVSNQKELLGWSRYPCLPSHGEPQIEPGAGPPPGLEHGQMLVRLIRSIAPAVTIWDAPLLPDTVLGPPGVAAAESMFERIRRDIVNHHRRVDQDPANDKCIPHGPWILVNAWGVLDPFHHDPFSGDSTDAYWDNPKHSLLQTVQNLSDTGIDVIFAAGNCGTPGAHPLCAESATGPGRSINGVNAHQAVLTVGAVRVDGLPIGGSAQGPGALAKGLLKMHLPPTQEDDAYRKPDLCAPSYFRNDEDAKLVNTGTSAACGIAAGIVAALRSEEVQAGLWSGDEKTIPGRRRRTPPELRAIMRTTAFRVEDQDWDPRLGWGIANLSEARRSLKKSWDTLPYSRH